MVFLMHISPLSHEGEPYTCEVHPYVRGRIHASETPYTTSSLRPRPLGYDLGRLIVKGPKCVEKK